MDVRKNVTSIFIVPTLKIDRDKLRLNGCINGYIRDEGREVNYEDCVYLVFRPNNMDIFKEFMDGEYERTERLIEDYDYDGGFVVMVYQLDEKWNDDYALVKQGKYSLTSEAFQKQFPKIVKVTKNGLRRDEISLQYRVFNKTEDVRKYWEDKIGIQFTDDMEVWQGFVEEDEVLNIEKLRECITS